MNHRLTEDQQTDAVKTLNITEFVKVPEPISNIWSNIPPDVESISEILSPVVVWLSDQASTGDVALIQGDSGACYIMVTIAFDLGLLPVYATTERITSEKSQKDGAVKIERQFRHVRFRKYQTPYQKDRILCEAYT